MFQKQQVFAYNMKDDQEKYHVLLQKIKEVGIDETARAEPVYTYTRWVQSQQQEDRGMKATVNERFRMVSWCKFFCF